MLGMAHRGRLNVLAHVLGKPYAPHPGRVRRPRAVAAARARLRRHRRGLGRRREVPRRRAPRASAPSASTAPSRRSVTVVMAPNPSHLEFVNPVVAGHGPRRRRGPPARRAAAAGRGLVAGVLIHGDAAFPARASSPRRSTCRACAGYRTGGTIHIIANNQLGFTTEPARRPLDAVRQRPGQGLRDSDRARQRRRPDRLPGGHPAGRRLPRRVRQGLSRST